MCGIAGMLVGDGLVPADVAEVAALGDLMARRGPDDVGAWDDGSACALTFRRLAIIDLSERGHQPMISADGEHVLVFNGEIYNFAALRSELEAAGRTFVSTSDTEVVLQGLAEWGTGCLARLNGMFALGWYRPRLRRLVIARDPIGIKPLAWWSSGDAFVFGSQYDQVVRHRRCDRGAVDARSLELYLRLGYLPAPYGLIENTGQVEPGHYVVVDAGGAPSDHTFRLPAAPVPATERLVGRAAEDAVAAAVDDAVRRQRVSDVPMGCFLSGGVDSPLVAAAMQQAGDSPVPAFTIGTDDAHTDETSAATAYAAVLGVEHHVRRITGADALAMLPDVAQAYSEPFGDFSSFPTMLVSALAAEHVKVVQSGDGGDELFWGYPRFAKVRAARKWFAAPRALRVAAYAATKPLAPARRPARGVMFPTLGDWYLDAHSGLRTDDLARITTGLPGVPPTFHTFELDGAPDDDTVLQWMRTNELACHLPMVLHKVDRASMHHSLEVRVPLLDLEVVDLAATVDPSACLDGPVGKVVLRRALQRHVPPDRIPVPKKGFTVPLRQWLRDDLRPAVESLLLDRDPFPHGVFDREGLRSFYDDHLAGRRDHTKGLWNLLSLQMWADTHLRPLTGEHS